MADIFLFYFNFIVICVMSLIMGGAIGLEREYRQKPAGLKTHTLICIGAAVFTFLSDQFGYAGDPSRIAAQVVSGIGFIGAGTIMQSKQVIQGLTTASTLWIVAAIGMLNGAGFIIPGALLTLFVAIFLLITSYFYRSKREREQYSLNIEIAKLQALDIIEDMIDKFDLNVEHKNLIRKDTLHLHINYTTTPLTQHLFLKRLFGLKDVGEIIKI